MVIFDIMKFFRKHFFPSFSILILTFSVFLEWIWSSVFHFPFIHEMTGTRDIIILINPEVSNTFSLFRNKRLMLHEMTYKNASILPFFLEHKNPSRFFIFLFWSTVFPNKCPDLVGLTKKNTWGFVLQKFVNFWSISLGHKI